MGRSRHLSLELALEMMDLYNRQLELEVAVELKGGTPDGLKYKYQLPS